MRSGLIDRALREADLFVAIGTSGAVYPAAGFVAEARAYGLRTCEINLEAADNADLFDEQRLGPASETVPAWVEELVVRDSRSYAARSCCARCRLCVAPRCRSAAIALAPKAWRRRRKDQAPLSLGR